MTHKRGKVVRVRSSSACPCLSDRLRSLRALAIERGRRVFQLVQVEGVRVQSPVVRGEFSNVVEALDAARRFGVSSCVVREWACLPDGVRVHVNSVEWLLSWSRVRGLRPSPPCEAAKGRADSQAEREALSLAGASGAPPEAASKPQGSFYTGGW